MADNLRKFTTQEVLNKVYTDSSGITIGLNSQSSKETLNAVLDSSNNRLQVAMAGGTISGDVTISGDLTVTGDSGGAYSEIITDGLQITKDTDGEFVSLILVNESDADSTAGIVSQRFDLEDTGGTAVDSGKILVGKEASFTATASSQDSYMAFQTSLNGTLAERMRISSTGATVTGTLTTTSDIKIPANVELQESAQGDSGNRIKLKNSSTGNMEFNLESASFDYVFLTGKVGIGTTVPTYALDIHSSLGLQLKNGSNNTVFHIPSSSGYTFGTQTNNHMSMSTNNTERMRITNAGDVQIKSSTDAKPILTLEQTGDNSNAGQLIFLTSGTAHDNDDSGRIEFKGMNDASTPEEIEYATIFVNHNDVSDGAEDATMFFKTQGAGYLHNRLVLDGTSRISLSNNASFDGGTANTVFGKSIGTIDAGSNNNVFIGEEVASDGTLSDATNNVIIGYQAGEDLTTADNNTAIGSQAGKSINTGTVTALGYQAAYSTTSGTVTAIGLNAGYSHTINYYGIYIGTNAGKNIAKDQNTVVGDLAMSGGDTTASNNSADGVTAIGYKAYGGFTGSSDDIDGHSGVAIGNSSMGNITSGNFNTAVGVVSGLNITLASNSTYLGAYAGHFNQTGANNVAVGANSQYGANGSSHQNNTSVGKDSLKVISTGNDNTAIGLQAGTAITTGSNNVVLGANAGDAITSDANVVAIGYGAYSAQDTANDAEGSSGHGSGNIAIGYQTMTAFNEPDFLRNTAVGFQSMSAGTSNIAQDNTTLGYRSLQLITTGDNNVAIGSKASGAITTGGNNTAIGKSAMSAMIAGAYNIAIGSLAMADYKGDDGNNAGSKNIAIGASAMETFQGGTGNVHPDTRFDRNIALGYNSFRGADFNNASVVVTDNIAIGDEALNSTGVHPQLGTIAIGSNALTALTTGTANTAIGYQAAAELSDNSHNTVVGYQAMYRSGATVYYNTFIGSQSGSGDWSGGAHSNTAVGAATMTGVMTGAAINNVAVGRDTLTALTIGNNNTAVGKSAMAAIVDGTYNTAVGAGALDQSVDGVRNVSLGGLAHGNADTGNYNIAVGYQAGYVVTGDSNITIGDSCGVALTTGNGNVLVGSSAGASATSGLFNTLLGSNADVDAATDSYQTKIGAFGIIKYKTARITLNDSYGDTPAEHDAAHDNSLFNIPSYSYISKISVKVITLSANGTATFSIYKSATLNTASGLALNGDRIELLGANAEDNAGIKVRSQNAQTADSDIVASSGGTANMVWLSNIDVTVDNSVGWIADANSGAGWGIYIGHAGGNTGSDGGADAVLDIMVEYY